MNKNKLILAIIMGIILAIIVWVVATLNTGKQIDGAKNSSVKDYSIWLYQDDSDKLLEVLQNFQKKYPAYKNTVFNVESFSDYEDYTFALQSAFAQNKAPDLFVLNNSEKYSLFSEYTQGIDPEIINPNDFRKKYVSVFSEDLIDTIIIGEGEKAQSVEFLKGIPVGYETLGIYYNKAKLIKDSDFDSLGTLNGKIAQLKNKYPSGIPLALGNGSTVQNIGDIISQFFLLENDIISLKDITGGKMKSALTSYMLYGDINENNTYNSRQSNMVALGKIGLDLFARNEAFMIVGYPRMLLEIDKKGYKKGFLAAAPFPFYNLSEGKTLINYNYFVKNKFSESNKLSDNLLQYLMTDSGVEKYLAIYSYYLPALLSLESDKLEAKVLEGYNNITLGDFYNPDHLLQTFDVGIKSVFDRKIQPVLDDTSNYIDTFTQFQNKLLCQTRKYQTLENLSLSCE